MPDWGWRVQVEGGIQCDRRNVGRGKLMASLSLWMEFREYKVIVEDMGHSGIREKGTVVPQWPITTVPHLCGPVWVWSMCTTTNGTDSGVRHEAPPYCSPLFLCTGRSLCLTDWGPEPLCSPDSAPLGGASPVDTFYMSLDGSAHIWPGCTPWVSSIDGCRLCTGRTWKPVHL